MDLLIETINELDLGWKADTCKLQKHHSKYGDHCDDLELAQVDSQSNINAKLYAFGEAPGFDAAWNNAKQF